MTSRERLMASLRGEPVDRVPVNFYEIGGIEVDPGDPDDFNIYNDSSWKPLLDLANTQTDLIRMRSPESIPAPDNPREEFFKVESYTRDGSRYVKTELNIAGKTLTEVLRRDPGMDTNWRIQHYLQCPEDLEAFLTLPDEVFAEEVSVKNLFRAEEEIGDRGIVMVDTSDPLCIAAELFHMQDYLLIASRQGPLFHRLLEKIAVPLYDRVEKVSREFPDHLWRVYGPEYATVPYLAPGYFPEYVVRYTQPIIERIQRYGGFARVHCHGNVRTALPHFVEMGASATDPLEPPPQGDIDLLEVRKRFGKDLTLFGNLEVSDIENLEPYQFEKVVLKTLQEGTRGAGKGFVLMPTACPYGREISPLTMTNYETIVRVAREFDLTQDDPLPHSD